MVDSMNALTLPEIHLVAVLLAVALIGAKYLLNRWLQRLISELRHELNRLEILIADIKDVLRP
jgi:hypothetical protein